MSININSPGGVNQGAGARVDQLHTRDSKNVGDSAKVSNSNPNPGQSAGGDKVTLTNQAERLQKLDAELQATPDIDQARVDAIKSAIADGSFKIDADAIADKLIQTDKDLS